MHSPETAKPHTNAGLRRKIEQVGRQFTHTDTTPPANTQVPSIKTPERVIATVRLNGRSFLRVAVKDGGIIIRKFTADGRRIFLPTGLPLKLGNPQEARDLIAGITAALAEVSK